MGKRRKIENSEENIRKKPRNRIVIYSSDEESNRSARSDLEPDIGSDNEADTDIHTVVSTSRVTDTQNDTSSPVRHPPPLSPRVQIISPPQTVAAAIADNITGNEETSHSGEEVEANLDEDLLVLLGEAPEPETSLGKPVHKDVAARWLDILKKGLSKEIKEKLAKEYLVPNNCELLIPPILNPEAKAALTEMFVKRDNSLMYRQKQISNSVAALAQAIDVIITNKNCDQDLKQRILKPVNDACRILCDMHYAETLRRRKFVVSSVNTGMKEVLANSVSEKFLFGDNMSEKLKAAKTVQKSGEALKAANKPVFQKNNFYKNKNRSNYKPLHQKTAGRQDAGRVPPPAGPRSQAGNYQQRRAPERPRDRSPPPPPPRRYTRR